MNTFKVTVNDKEYTIQARDVDEAMCSAYRKYYVGKANVFDHIMWHLGKTKEVVTIVEIVE